MEGTPDQDIPTPPVEATAQTAPSVFSTQPNPKIQSQEYLGQNLAVDISDMVRATGEVVLHPIAVAAINSWTQSLGDARDEAEAQLKTERERTRDLAQRLAGANQQTAVLEERLNGLRAQIKDAQETASLRNVFYALGGAAVGLIPFAADKGGWVGGIVAAVFGVALLQAARHRFSKSHE
jgi:hypothetical protein